LYLQWKVGDRCMAVWSENMKLYEAKIIETDESNHVCRVEYDRCDDTEERSWVELCPVDDRHMSRDKQYHDNRQKRDRHEGRDRHDSRWQVVTCMAYYLSVN